MDWHEVWERKGSIEVATPDLETLIELDGWDAGLGRLTPEQFHDVAELVARELELAPGMRLLEVGCGAGALLWCLRPYGVDLLGVDYSAQLLRHAAAAVPEATLALAEAAELHFTADAIVCHGVFHYFPDLEYARRVLDAFSRAAPVALILDIPDLATRDAAERARGEAGAKPGKHLYYPRSFFEGAKIWSNDIVGYGNAPFRFHALLNFRE